MKALLSRLRDLDAAQITGALVLALIAADLLSGSGGAAPSRPDDRPSEVQNYVLFTTVQDGPATFTTGTQFDSTAARHIASQWCYMARSADDALDPHVTLATASASGRVATATVAPEALARFGIQADALSGMIARDCRFQHEG